MSVIEIDQKLSGLKVGTPQGCHGLTVYPLFEERPETDDFLTLDEGLEQGFAKVTEVSEGGSVPTLRFLNGGSKPILLLDGEELVGSKQNRIINLSILVPAESEVVIPVSCVERGRWTWRSRSSGSSNRAIYSKLRSKKLSQVSDSLAGQGLRDADQIEIWEDISMKAERMQAFSDTEASGAIYERYREELDEFILDLKPAHDQVGAVFAVAGRTAGIEIFRSPRLFSKLFHKIVRSYGLDAVDERGKEDGLNSTDINVGDLLSAITAAKVERYPAIGLGDDVRLNNDNLVGAALADKGMLVHLAAFPREWAA